MLYIMHKYKKKLESKNMYLKHSLILILLAFPASGYGGAILFVNVLMLWSSVTCFWCHSFSVVSPYVCSYYLSSVSVAEWPPFGK